MGAGCHPSACLKTGAPYVAVMSFLVAITSTLLRRCGVHFPVHDGVGLHCNGTHAYQRDGHTFKA